MPFQVFRTSDFVRFALGMRVLTLLPKICRCSKFYFVLVQASFGMKGGPPHLVGSWLQR